MTAQAPRPKPAESMSGDENKINPPRIGNFHPKLLSRSWLIFFVAQWIVAGLVAAVFVLTVDIFSLSIAVLISVSVLLVIESLVGYFLLKQTLKPIETIARCLIYIRGEPSNLPLPDRDNPKFIKSGLGLLLNTILDSASQNNNQPVTDEKYQIYRDILEALPVGFIVMNPERKIIASNSLAPIHTAPDKKHSIQLDFTNTNDSLDDWLKQVCGNEIESEKIWSHVQNVAPNQPDRRVFDVIAHYRQNAPNGAEIVVVTVDRTTEYWGEEDNADFVALAAHELRGPITVIRGYLDILEQQLGSQLTSEQHELIDRLNVSAKRLSSYVNNILNASRYDHKHLKLQLREVTIDSIMDYIKDDMALRAKTQNRTITWQVPAELPTVAADLSSISEVLANLIDNAIKYSHDGGQIEITARVEDGFVAISIADHGVGIPSVVASNLFSKFYRSHRSRDTIGGTGIGLFISRGIIESHGGHIGVQSTEGEGSTFTFTLPIYATVADKLETSADNESLIREGGSWIKNHNRLEQ